MICPPVSSQSARTVAVDVVLILLANALIAGLLTLIHFGGTYLENLIYSECIGLSIMGFVHLVLRFGGRATARGMIFLLGAVLAGSMFGIFLAHWLVHPGQEMRHAIYWESLAIGLFFGGIGSVVFIMRERTLLLNAELKDRELRRVEADKRGIDAQLKMLQAQVEPHFLFNTLANLAGLIETEPKLASQLLSALNRYLRASLRRTRADGGSLGDEVDLLTAYLETVKIRFGERIEYAFEVDDTLRGLPFPPMLLQPLVENAIRHGIEPLLGNGRIDISARRRSGQLVVTVSDTGVGLGMQPGNGFGLDNIRARLAALFDGRGRLDIYENDSGGVTTELTIPI